MQSCAKRKFATVCRFFLFLSHLSFKINLPSRVFYKRKAMRRVCCAVICCLILLSSNVLATETKINETANSKCAIMDLKTALRTSDAVFAGEVLSETKNGNEKVFEFRVAKYWKGSGRKKITVSVRETTRFQAFFRVGESYLVFARDDEDGRLRDYRCSASKLLSEASKDLKQLGRVRIPR